MSLYTDEFLSFMRLPKTCLTIASVEGKHSRSQRLTFLPESPPKGTHQPITIFTHHQIFTKKYGYKKMALKSTRPLSCQTTAYIQQPAFSAPVRSMPASMPANTCLAPRETSPSPRRQTWSFSLLRRTEGGGSLGRFPWGFMAGLEKGKCYHVISSKHSANSRIFGVTPFSAKMN